MLFFFFTLTYDNEHAPIATYNFETDTITTNRSDVPEIKLFDYINYEQNYAPTEFPKLCIDYNSKTYENKKFTFVSKSDVQKFLKRLRRHIEYDTYGCLSGVPASDRSLRYFICSEYGPHSSRAHYHGLLFCRSKLVSQAIAERYIYEAWPYCDRRNLDCQPVITCASSYVSKYVVASTSVPPILQIAPFRSFYLRSTRPAIGSNAFTFDMLRDKLEHHDLTYCKTVVNTAFAADTLSLSISRVAFNRYFSPLYCESRYTRDNYIRFYNSYSKYVSDDLLRYIHDKQSYKFNYKNLSSLLPNRIKDVNSRVEAFMSFNPRATLSDVYNLLSYEEICFGISQNRSSIIHYMLLHIDHSLTLIDYVDLRLRLATLRFSYAYESFVEAYNSAERSTSDSLALLWWSYPSLFSRLPKFLCQISHDEYISLSLCFSSIGYDVEDFYDNGLLIDFNLPTYSTNSEYQAYVNYVANASIAFDKKRKIASMNSLGYNKYSPI